MKTIKTRASYCLKCYTNDSKLPVRHINGFSLYCIEENYIFSVVFELYIKFYCI